MITIKKPKEIKLIRESGRILATTLNELARRVKPGVTTGELNQLAEDLIARAGGEPSFKGYRSSADQSPFPTALCASINSELVHAPALPSRSLQEGDMIGLDLGVNFKGFFTDMAVTVPVGRVSDEVLELIRVTKESLDRGLEQIKPGKLVADISRAIQNYVEAREFSVIRDLVGHGVGYQVHEDPRVPNFFDPRQPKVELKPGLVLAIEPMVSLGDWRVRTLNDGWTVVMADASWAAHFEQTVAVTKTGYELLTKV